MTPKEQAGHEMHCRRLVKLMFALERQAETARQAPLAMAERNYTDLKMNATAVRYALGKLDPDGVFIEGYTRGMEEG